MENRRLDRYKVELDRPSMKADLGKWDIEEQRAEQLKKEQEEAKEAEGSAGGGGATFKVLNFESEKDAEPS